MSRSKFRDKIWVSEQVKRDILYRNVLYRIWLKAKTQNTFERYLAAKKVCCNSVLRAKANYYNLLFNCKSNSIKQVWANLNRYLNILRKSKKAVCNSIKIPVGNNSYDQPVDVANLFNEYFCNVSVNIINNLLPASKEFKSYLPSPIINSLYFSPISLSDISHKLLKRLKTKFQLVLTDCTLGL